MANSTDTANDCFWRHLWGKWEKKKEGSVSVDGRVVGFWLLQERVRFTDLPGK